MKNARRILKEMQAKTPLQQIESAEHQLLVVSWKGTPCIVKARELSDLEVQAAGNFSLIETEEFKWSRAQVKTDWSEMRAYAEKNVVICKAALISPTYDEIFEAIGKTAFNLDVKARVESINKLLDDMPPGPGRQELEGIRDSLIAAWCIVLPADFMAGVIEFALQIRKTEIKKITEDMLFSSAILAERGHKAPHEYIHGQFTAFNVRDIDAQAWAIYDEKIREQREAARRPRGPIDAD